MDAKKLLSNQDTWPWIKDRTILLTRTGSHAYGTNTEDSDQDFKGIVIPPKEYYLGMNSFEHYNNKNGKSIRNTKDDIDVSLVAIRKFFKEASGGAANTLELLFTRPEDYIMLDSYGDTIIRNRQLFLSKQVFYTFGGYARGEAKRMIHNKNRTELVEAYGYDTKHFMHTVRLLQSAIEILDTEDFSTYRDNHSYLLDLRNGLYTLPEASKLIEKLEHDMNVAYRSSKLREETNFHLLNEILIDITSHAIEREVFNDNTI